MTDVRARYRFSSLAEQLHAGIAQPDLDCVVSLEVLAMAPGSDYRPSSKRGCLDELNTVASDE